MADVCMILEGTYPYITGGVSSWVHELITNLGDVTFDIITIVPDSSYTLQIRYKMPKNIVSLTNVYLNEIDESRREALGFFEKRDFFKNLSNAIADFRASGGRSDKFASIVSLFKTYSPLAGDILNPENAWKLLREIYFEFCGSTSFIDFFWTMRSIIIPLFNILALSPPNASCYHAISTGYAGLLASSFGALTQRPVLLTEHGIYTNERLLEIIDAGWIFDEKKGGVEITRELSELKKLWVEFYQNIGKITYACSTEIITLYHGNRRLQIKHGAPPEKCRVVPNGIDIEKFSLKRSVISSGPEYRVGFVGRIVPIKDIKTLLYAARLVIDKLPGARFILKGPYNEDAVYYDECLTLAGILGLEKNMEFTGPGPVHEFYGTLDLIVLSSISEAQPLAILEGNACAVPAVTTDVGCARELIYGGDEEDMKIGASGTVVNVKSPEELGNAIIDLLQNSEKNRKMGEAGLARVLKYYKKEDLIKNYRELYAKFKVK